MSLNQSGMPTTDQAASVCELRSEEKRGVADPEAGAGAGSITQEQNSAVSVCEFRSEEKMGVADPEAGAGAGSITQEQNSAASVCEFRSEEKMGVADPEAGARVGSITQEQNSAASVCELRSEEKMGVADPEAGTGAGSITQEQNSAASVCELRSEEKMGVADPEAGAGAGSITQEQNSAASVCELRSEEKMGVADPEAGAGAGSITQEQNSAADKRTFELEVLEAHNQYRQQHGAPSLKLSTELCESSQQWVDHLVSINELKHSGTTNGENIWCGTYNPTGKKVVDSWYAEVKDYNFSKPGFDSKTGHFTQVVWKDTKEMGIAKAVDGKGKVIAVAQYNPAGNMTNTGYFEKNVLPLGSPPATAS